jgi:hypothetical protein
MTKEEVKNRLIESGLINRFKNHPLWVQAFNLYNSHKDANLKPTCGTCFKKVKEWLLN